MSKVIRMAIFFTILALSPAQKTTSHTLKLQSGSIHCTFTNYSPPVLTGLHVDCVTPTSSVKLDNPLTASPFTGAVLSERDSLTWTFQQSSPTSPALYKTNANGKIDTGSL